MAITIENVQIPDFNVNIAAHTLASDISKTLYDCVSSCTIINPEHSGVSRSRNTALTGSNSVNINDNAFINNATLDSAGSVSHYRNRWERLLKDPDDARVWKALDWKGQFCDNNDKSNATPSDVEFKDFYESYLNQYINNNSEDPLDNVICPYIPILDDPIVPDEVITQINRMKSNKSCGPDGIPPGLFKLLTPQWILLITS